MSLVNTQAAHRVGPAGEVIVQHFRRQYGEFVVVNFVISQTTSSRSRYIAELHAKNFNTSSLKTLISVGSPQ